jgi:YVTN family beta-propeller protein
MPFLSSLASSYKGVQINIDNEIKNKKTLKKKKNFFLLLILIPITFAILINSSSHFQFSSTRIFVLAQEEKLDITGEALYVGNAKSNSISVIDLLTNTVAKNITVGNSPHDIKISDDQQIVYATDTDLGTVSIVNATTNTLMNQITTGGNGGTVHGGIAIFNGTLYVGDVYGGKVLVIKDNAIKEEIKVGYGPEYMEIRPDGKVLYVANPLSSISVIDLADNKVIKDIDSGITPHGLSFTKDGSRLFIVNIHNNTLSVIDAKKHELINTIPVGKNPEYVELSPHETIAYVANLGSDTVSEIDLTTLQVMAEIPVGKGPHEIAFSADGDLVYVSNMKGNNVSIINTSTDKIVATIPLGGIEPHQIVIKKPYVKIISDEDNYTTGIPVYVDVANDPEEQSRGLMFRKSMEWNNGMLFVYEDVKYLSFWMKNTYIPLDMIFIDKDLRIVDIKEDIQPCLEEDICPSYPSKQPAKYVLEVNAGFVQQNGIRVGDILYL